MLQLLWKRVGSFLKKLKLELEFPYDPTLKWIRKRRGTKETLNEGERGD